MMPRGASILGEAYLQAGRGDREGGMGRGGMGRGRNGEAFRPIERRAAARCAYFIFSSA